MPIKPTFLPQCTLATPSIDEAQVLLGQEAIDRNSQEDAACALYEKLGCNVLLKGGHLQGDLVDLLFDGNQVTHFQHPRLENVNTHGSGCMLSAAVTAELAKGQTLHGAVETGLQAVHRALAQPQILSNSLSLGAVEASYD